jgi:hypothetical protein
MMAIVHSDDTSGIDASQTDPLESRAVSRRGALLAMGGVAAGGLGLAAGASAFGASAAGAAGPSGLLTFLFPLPFRVLDTRFSDNPADPDANFPFPLEANTGYILNIGGVEVDGMTVPTDAVGVIGTVTAVNPTGNGYFTLFATAEIAPPLASNLNFQVGDMARASGCTVMLNSGGQMTLYTSAGTDAIFDVTGYLIAQAPAV